MGTEPADYCREIETYLCKKNDGHLIRVVGPSFACVTAWERQGIPLKVAFAGIDRYFERYYRQGPRRRPVKIDFCEADVLDVFDEWRRATLQQSSVVSRPSGSHSHQSGSHSLQSDSRSHQSGSHQSLPQHVERVVTRLSSARAGGAIGDAFDPLVDAVSHELDVVRAAKGGLRGEARQTVIARLADLDREMLRLAGADLDGDARAALAREADEQLAPFRSGMAPEAYARAHDAAVAQLIRERLRLPTIAFTI